MTKREAYEATDRPTVGGPLALLTRRLAMASGLVRPGTSLWDGTMRLPLQPLNLELAYADPLLLRALGARGADFVLRLNADVVVGAETAGVPLAAAISLACDRPFAFVRKPGYRGHEHGEPAVRGATVSDRRVLLVEDAVWRGSAVEGFVSQLLAEGAKVVGLFCMVDMRDVADTVTPVAAALPTESVGTYLDVLAAAEAGGVIEAAVYALAVDAIVNRWTDEDPRWSLLDEAS